MLVQPLRATDLRVGPDRRQDAKVAVLLNANARKVSEKVIRSLSHVVPREDLFLSRSMIDARRIIQTVLERRYHTVFTGGGDGTFMSFVNETLKQLEHRNQYHHQAPPKFGVLKLGTGNGIASCVNASPLRGERILDDVLRARAGEVPGYRELDLLMIDGRRAHFAGVGVDGRIINDFLWVKQNLGRKPVLKTWMAEGPGAYFWGVALRTVPHYLGHSALSEIEIYNTDDRPAFRLGSDGAPVAEYRPGERMFKGKVSICSAGTTPYFGYHFRAFPFAGRRRGYFSLRAVSITSGQLLSNLSSVWKGKYFKGFNDFHARKVSIRSEEQLPFQMGGEPEGYRKELTIEIAPERVELVDFSHAVN